MSITLTDVRYALRKLSRAPVFTAVSLITLAIGIGATTAIFGLVSSILLEPLPFPEADRLISIQHTAPGLGMPRLPNSDGTYFLYHEEARAFDGIAITSNREVNLAGDQLPIRVPALAVTADYFTVLGTTAVLGRTFRPDDDRPGAPLTVMLTSGLWRRRFGGTSDLRGISFRLDGEQVTVIGIAPETARLAGDPDIFLPLRLDRSRANSGSILYQGIGRLKSGATLATATADLNRLIAVLPERFPGLSKAAISKGRFEAKLQPLKDEVLGDVGGMLWTLLGAVAVVLLIACANVANLTMVRAEGRHREMAVRTAMGAGRGRIAGYYLVESMVLAGLGGLLGLGLAYLGLRGLVALGPDSLPRLREVGIDRFGLGFAVAISVGAGIGFGALVALRQGRSDPARALRQGDRGSSSGRERHRVRNSLVIGQVALALLLLVGSGLLIRSFQALRTVDPGFRDADQILTFRLALVGDQFQKPGAVAAAHERLLERLAGLPGVTHVGAVSAAPMTGVEMMSGIYVEDRAIPEGTMVAPQRTQWTLGDFFPTFGIPVVAGRLLDWADVHSRARRLVVNATFARFYWNEPARAVGRRIRTDPTGEWWEIVGVVGDVRDRGADLPAPPIAYFPAVSPSARGQDSLTAVSSLTYAIKSVRPDPASLTADIRRAIGEVSPDLPLADVRTVGAIVAKSMARTSFAMILIGLAAMVALFLGAVGLYGVIAYLVSERTREIGIRMAFGADHRTIRRMVVREGLRLGLIGIGIGMVAAVGLTRLLSALLFGVSPLDPLTFGVVSGVLVGVALVASWVPAHRATTVDPVEALRAQG